MNATINLDNEAESLYDRGLLYYASDTPYHRRESLLSRSMGISGVESVYACSAAVLQKIFSRKIRSVLEAYAILKELKLSAARCGESSILKRNKPVLLAGGFMTS